MAVVHEPLKNRVHHKGYIARVVAADFGLAVYVGSIKLGEFVFSDGHDGLAPFSNSFGIDCYQLTERLGKNAWLSGPLYRSRRNIVKDLIDFAIEHGTLN